MAALVAAVPSGLRPVSIGIAATASTVAIVRPHDGAPQRPGILWADHRATREADTIRGAGHRNLERMLGHVSPEWGIAKLAWLAASGELAGTSGIVVEAADWLGFRLTGLWAANAGTREWGWAGGDDGRVPADLLEAAGAPGGTAERVIHKVRPSGSVLGAVRDGAGWPDDLRGVPVLVGGMDSYLAAVGSGAAAPGRLCLTVGSSSAAIGGLACGDATGRMFGPLRTAIPGLPGAWQGGQTTAGLAAAWARDVLGGSVAALDRAAAASPPGSRGVTFRETLLDRRNPDPRSPLSGGWSGLHLDHGRGDLYRATLEGIAFGLAEACAGLEPSEVVASGGMMRSVLFRAILADVLRRPVARLRMTIGSAAALGAAFADVPERVPAVIRVAAVTDPSGADYGAARERYLRAEPPTLDAR